MPCALYGVAGECCSSITTEKARSEVRAGGKKVFTIECLWEPGTYDADDTCDFVSFVFFRS